MKLSDLRSHEAVLSDQLKDPDFHAQWERMALARAVARRIIGYRVEHDLSQTAMGRLLGMRQPAIALEAGEHNPSIETLMRLASVLGVEFMVNVTPALQQPRLSSAAARSARVVESIPGGEGQVFVAVS